MVKVEKVEVVGFGPALRGMRNPKNSWAKADSLFDDDNRVLGDNDRELASTLVHSGPSHSKFRRMIGVYMDITAPLYWWKEFDTYKVGTVADSCSTMHKIDARDLTLNDFSTEYLLPASLEVLKSTIACINYCRKQFKETGDKKWWQQMIQLLPTSYNQKRTVMVNYEVLANMYSTRRNHKLDEWRYFCHKIKDLPFADVLIIGD